MITYLKQKILLTILVGLTITSCSKEKPNQGHKLTSHKFQGIPSLAISSEGRLWATWYAGITPDEDQNNYVVVATGSNDG